MMNPVIKKKWIEALLSDRYIQGDGYLRINEIDLDTGCEYETYCCLGVLCDLYAQDTGQSWDEGTGAFIPFKSFRGKKEFPPEEVCTWANLEYVEEDFEGEEDTDDCPIYHLSVMNDHGSTFSEIVEYIDNNL